MLGGDHPNTLISMHSLAALYRKLGRLDEADALATQAVGGARAKLAPTHPFRLAAIGELGTTRTMLGRHEEAEALLMESYDGLSATFGPTHERTIGLIERLVDLYTAWHAAEPDSGYDAKAAEWRGRLEAWQVTTQPAESQPATTQPAEDQPTTHVVP